MLHYISQLLTGIKFLMNMKNKVKNLSSDNSNSNFLSNALLTYKMLIKNSKYFQST